MQHKRIEHSNVFLKPCPACGDTASPWCDVDCEHFVKVRCDVLDKTTNEIEEYRKYCDDNLTVMTLGHIKQIINKYKDDGSSEGKEWKLR